MSKRDIFRNRQRLQSDPSSLYQGGKLSADELASFEQIGIASNALTLTPDGKLTTQNIKVHRTGLEFIGTVDETEYEIFGKIIIEFDTAYQWIIGDFLAFGETNNYGMATRLADELNRESETLNNWAWVCRQVVFSRRREDLSFSHHTEVAKLSPEEQTYWLDWAVTYKLTSKALRNQIKRFPDDTPKPRKTPIEQIETQFDALESKLPKWSKKASPEEKQQLTEHLRERSARLLEFASRIETGEFD